MKAVYPGTFDPITIGHLDIIKRSIKSFDDVTILIMANPRKQCLFSETERKTMIEKVLKKHKGFKNVKVMIGEGLTVDYAKKMKADVIIRGIRAVSDYEYELQQATANMALNDEIETLFMISKPAYSFLSSSIVKEIAYNDGDISAFVPKEIIQDVLKKVAEYK